MHAQGRAATRAGSSLSFKGEKSGQSFFPDHLQVCDETRAVFCAVAFIELQHAPAGIIGAFVTKFGLRLRQMFALHDDTTLYRYRLGIGQNPAAGAMVFLPQIGQAGAAIHPAGRDQNWVKLDWTMHKSPHYYAKMLM